MIDQGYTVIAFIADVGQDEDFDAVRQKAERMGFEKFVVEDLRREFTEQLCFRAIQANAIYESR